jgi:hypothetical protein
MGCDGGTIPKRHELVKTAKKVEKLDTNLSEAAKYLLCALSKVIKYITIMLSLLTF